MRTFIIGFIMILTGLVFGVTLTEISLRTFMPELAQKQTTLETGYITNLTTKSDAELNEHGFREADALTGLQADSWIALGGSTAFGVGVDADKRFSEEFETLTGQKVYNAAQVGMDADMKAELAAIEKLEPAAQKVVYVIDLGLPPHVLLGRDAPEGLNPKQSFIDSLVLKQVLTGQSAPVEQKIEAWSLEDADAYAKKVARTFVKYRTVNEHFIVLVAPSRGHSFENSYGATHRNNQKIVTDALRRHQGIYAVDLSYLAKMDYADQSMLYSDDARLNEKGHSLLANGFLKQFETFSTWKSFDELTPEEQEQVREDMRRTQEEEAQKRAQNPF